MTFPKTLVIETTNYCPFRCPHCYVKKTPKRMITPTVLMESIKKIKKEEIQKVIIHGGEPFTIDIHKLNEIASIVSKNFPDVDIEITSNPDFFFRKDKIEERIDFIQRNHLTLTISLDKYRNFWRNQKETFKYLRYVKKENIKIKVVVTLLRKTSYNWLISLVIKLLKEELIDEIFWEREIPALSKNRKDYLPHHDFFDILNRLLYDFNHYFGKNSLVRYFSFLLVPQRYKLIPMIGCSYFCTEGVTVIDTDGSLSSCTKKKYAEHSFKYKEKIEDVCKNCYLLPYCKFRCSLLPTLDEKGECIMGRLHIPWDKFLNVK